MYMNPFFLNILYIFKDGNRNLVKIVSLIMEKTILNAD